MQDVHEQNFSAFWRTLEELETHVMILDGKTQIYLKLQCVTRGGFHILHLYLNEEQRDNWILTGVTIKSLSDIILQNKFQKDSDFSPPHLVISYLLAKSPW